MKSFILRKMIKAKNGDFLEDFSSMESIIIKNTEFLRINERFDKKISSVIFSSLLVGGLFGTKNLNAATCTIGSSEPCVSASIKGNKSLSASVEDFPNSSDIKTLKITGGTLDHTDNTSITANKSILNVGNLSVENGATLNVNFQDSAWNTLGGRLTITRGGFTNTSNLNFKGSYQGNDSQALKGYAFYGDMLLTVGIINVNFQDNANVKGTLSTNANNTYSTGSSLKINFKNSSLEGALSTIYTQIPDYPTLNVSFDGNSLKGFAFDGGVSMNSSNINLNLSNGAIWKNASVNVEFGTFSVNANSGSKILLKSFGGPATGSGNNPIRNFNLNNSYLYGNTEGSTANITNHQGIINFTASNNSKVYVNFISEFAYTRVGVPRNSTLKFENSSLRGNITNHWLNSPRTDGLNTIVSFSGNDSDGFAFSGNMENQQSIMNVSFTNGAVWKNGNFINNDTSSLTFDSGSKMNGIINASSGNLTLKVSNNSTISNVIGAGQLIATISNANTGNITNTRNNSTLTFAFSTPSSGSVGVAGEESFSPIYTMGNISFNGKVSGIIDSAKMGNLVFGNNDNSSKESNLNINNSSLNAIIANRGSQVSLNISNSLIGRGGVAINSNWGILKGNLSASVVNGNITWSDGVFADKDGNTDKGLTFSNNSKLIGSIYAPTGGNFSTNNNFTFKSSAMQGDILINDKTKSGISNNVSVNFAENSSFKGAIIAKGSSVVNVSFADSNLEISNISATTSSSSISFDSIKNAKIGDIDFYGSINGDLGNSNIGNIRANNGKLDIKLDTSSIQNISNTNIDSKIAFSYNAPSSIAPSSNTPSSDVIDPAPALIAKTSIGNIDFAGVLSGEIRYADIGNIKNANANSDLSINNTNTGSFAPSEEKPFEYSIKDINYSGKLTAQLENTQIGDISLNGKGNDLKISKNSLARFVSINGGDSKFDVSNTHLLGGVAVNSDAKLELKLNDSVVAKSQEGSKTGSISVDNASATISLSKSLVQGGVNSSNNANSNISFKDGSSILGTLAAEKHAISNISFASEGAKIDFAKAKTNLDTTIQNLIKSENIKLPYPPTTEPKPESAPERVIEPISEPIALAPEVMPIPVPEVAPETAPEATQPPELEVAPDPAPLSPALEVAPADSTPVIAPAPSDVSDSPVSVPTLVAASATQTPSSPLSSPSSVPMLTKEQMQQANAQAIQDYLYTHPELIVKYLHDSLISAYYGNIQTLSNATHNVDFNDSLYLGGLFSNQGGNANITMIFSQDFINKLKENDLTNALVYGGDGPTFHILTQAQAENPTPITNIALAGDVKGKADIYYQDGYTNIIFSDESTGAFSGNTAGSANNTDFSSYVSGLGVALNGYSFKDGILILLNASKANSLLAPYRDLFANNYVQMSVDKISDPNIYKASISGVLVGEVDSLASSFDGSASVRSKAYEATLNPNAVFIGKLDIQDTNTSIKLSLGSKLILEDGSEIANLSSADGKDLVLDMNNIIGDSLTQKNTIIDLATGGIPSVKSNQKSSFSKLNINNIENLNNAVFRVAYNPNAQKTDEAAKKSDHIIINNAKSMANSPLFNYIQAYQNTSAPVLSNLADKDILVLSVKNTKSSDTAPLQAGLEFNTQSSVLQGYDIIHTDFEKRIENSPNGSNKSQNSTADKSLEGKDVADGADGTGTGVDSVDVADVAKSKAPEDISESWSNYYIKSALASIQDTPKTMTQAAISTSYSIFLANINDLNKRLGELRNDVNAQGVWARVFHGLSTSNRGEEVKTYSTNFQAGYDYAIPTDSGILGAGQSIFGLAFSYGYNTLKAANFTGKAMMLEAGLYYSYVGDSGFYSDSIAKYAFINNKLELENNQKSNTSLDVSSFSYGQEFGYRWDFTLKEKESSKHSIYVEPQAEAIAGYMSNGGFDQINGNSFLDSTISSILAIRARAGGVLAYSFANNRSKTDFRFGLSYVADFLQGGDIFLKSNMADANGKIESNEMLVASFGVNSSISDAWKVYLDVERGFLGKVFNQDYLISLGGRYSFGSKNLRITPNNKSTNKQSTKIPAGFYLEIYALRADKKLSPKQEELLKKYPYVVEYQYRTFNQNGKIIKEAYNVYLLGVFKSKQGALNNQKIADELSSVLYNQANQAQLREVR